MFPSTEAPRQKGSHEQDNQPHTPVIPPGSRGFFVLQEETPTAANETYTPGQLVDATGQKISGLDITVVTNEERDNFANALDALKQIIESKFQAMAQ